MRYVAHFSSSCQRYGILCVSLLLNSSFSVGGGMRKGGGGVVEIEVVLKIQEFYLSISGPSKPGIIIYLVCRVNNNRENRSWFSCWFRLKRASLSSCSSKVINRDWVNH